jgi:hypothetical protein
VRSSPLQDDELCAEYIGLEYPVALDLHLYFYSFRDVMSWAIANGFKWYRSSALNYDPKFHLKHSLDPRAFESASLAARGCLSALRQSSRL